MGTGTFRNLGIFRFAGGFVKDTWCRERDNVGWKLVLEDRTRKWRKKEKRHIADGVKKQENNTGIFAVNIDSHAYADVQSDCNVLECADVP